MDGGRVIVHLAGWFTRLPTCGFGLSDFEMVDLFGTRSTGTLVSETSDDLALVNCVGCLATVPTTLSFHANHGSSPAK